MAYKVVDDAGLTAIANKLREVEMTNQTYTVDEMAAAIQSLTEGPGDSSLEWDDYTSCKVKISQEFVDAGIEVHYTVRFSGRAAVTTVWGDTNTQQQITGSKGTAKCAHVYNRPGIYTISVTFSDTDLITMREWFHFYNSNYPTV